MFIRLTIHSAILENVKMGSQLAYVDLYRNNRYCFSTQMTSPVNGVLCWEDKSGMFIFQVSDTTKFDFFLRRKQARARKNHKIGHSSFRLNDQSFSMKEINYLPLRAFTKISSESNDICVKNTGKINIKVELL
jgi:uncharacterized membrane protein